MADLLQARLGPLELTLTPGNRGEFTVWVGERLVATKTSEGFPGDEEVVAGVEAALAG